jgi:hypothetical protein
VTRTKRRSQRHNVLRLICYSCTVPLGWCVCVCVCVCVCGRGGLVNRVASILHTWANRTEGVVYSVTCACAQLSRMHCMQSKVFHVGKLMESVVSLGIGCRNDISSPGLRRVWCGSRDFRHVKSNASLNGTEFFSACSSGIHHHFQYRQRTHSFAH